MLGDHSHSCDYPHFPIPKLFTKLRDQVPGGWIDLHGMHGAVLIHRGDEANPGPYESSPSTVGLDWTK